MIFEGMLDSDFYDVFTEDYNNLIDFRDKPLYGKINHSGEVLLPIYARMKRVVHHGESVFDFVADAFEDFRTEMELRPFRGKGLFDDRLAQIQPVGAAPDQRDNYEVYIDTLNLRFIRNSLSINPLVDTEPEKAIQSIEQYMEGFYRYNFIDGNNNPVTMTGFSKSLSKFCGPLYSGLVIELLDLDPTNIDLKVEFMSDPAFKNYTLTAKKFGFRIDKHIPWRIVADLSSDKMLGYLSKYNSTHTSIFDLYFRRTSAMDIELMQDSVIRAYHAFTRKNEDGQADNLFFSYPGISEKCGKTISLIGTREDVSKETFYYFKFNDFFWLKHYIRARAAEEQVVLSKSLLDLFSRHVYDAYRASVKQIGAPRWWELPPSIRTGKFNNKVASAYACRYFNAYLEEWKVANDRPGAGGQE